MWKRDNFDKKTLFRLCCYMPFFDSYDVYCYQHQKEKCSVWITFHNNFHRKKELHLTSTFKSVQSRKCSVWLVRIIACYLGYGIITLIICNSIRWVLLDASNCRYVCVIMQWMLSTVSRLYDSLHIHLTLPPYSACWSTVALDFCLQSVRSML